MKLILIFITAFSLYVSTFAQVNLPMVDGKICYEEVVKVDSVDKNTLYKNAETWVLSLYNDKKCTTVFDTASIKTNGYFIVFTKGAISKEIHGSITYNIAIDVKNGKYRYKFSDFVFHYYKINRTYKYEPSGKTKPLEDPKFPGWEPAWKRHKKDTDQRITTLIASLKENMVHKSVEKVAEEKLKVKKEDW